MYRIIFHSTLLRDNLWKIHISTKENKKRITLLLRNQISIVDCGSGFWLEKSQSGPKNHNPYSQQCNLQFVSKNILLRIAKQCATVRNMSKIYLFRTKYEWSKGRHSGPVHPAGRGSRARRSRGWGGRPGRLYIKRD